MIFKQLKGMFSKVILFPGNGIGPEIAESVVKVFSKANVPI